ncbi:MAG: gliding motility-associated C-terminal domain-containing protein, partial [candidate division KSB1 bacterium]|nr:gliding motility-associated C-terminal domain-containing protein [candidate division KSB1 bacterium]
PPSGYFSDAPDTVRQGERYVVHVRGATDGSGCGVQYIYLDAFTTAGGNPTTARDSLIGMNEPGIYFYRYFAEDHLKNRGVIRTDTTIVLPPSIQVPIFPVLAADTVFAGESFWVDVQIGTAQEPVAHLLHTRFTLNFDPTEAIEVVANDSIIPGNLFGANVTISHQLDEGNGKITFDIQQANHVGGADGFGSAVRIKFRCRSDLSHSIMAQFSITEATATDAWNFPIDLIPGTASLWLVKPLSDFVMTITPESQTIFPGDSTFFQLSFLPIGRFQGSIQLTVSGVPLAMQARYPTQPFAIPDSFRMIITSTNELVPADYPLIVQAFGADIVHTDTVMIRVLAPPMPDFTMRVVPDSQTIRQGENAIFRASFEPSGGFDALVQLETSPLPAGMTVDLPRQAFSIPTAVDIIFTTAGDIAVGVYRINLIAYGGGIRREQQIAIRILPRPDFIMTIIPDSQAVIAGGRISYQIAFEPVGGFNSSLVLNVSVSGDIEASHTTRPFNIPLTLEVNFYVPRNVPPGVYYPIVTATGGGITHEVTLAILVLPPNGSYSLQFDVQPNPFTPNGDGYNDQAIFRLPESSTAGITILIFDLKGRKITTIRERAAWDGRDEHGQVVAPGAYMFIVQHGTAVFSKGVIHVAR